MEEDEELTIDEYMASVGVDMLHPGGMRRTEELANMCEISGGKIVLDAGSGFGRTDCHLANKYRCEVVGIDISERMIQHARQNARKYRLYGMVHFQVGNIESIPFRDDAFDAVISEGTTVLTNKKRALSEYVRVTKRGGHIGLNELSWRKKPSREIVERTFADLRGVTPLEYDEWVRLLLDSGLKAVQSRTYKYKSTSWAIIKSLGARAIIKVGIKYMTNCKLRKWIDRQESLFREYSDYWGYGLYVGTK